MWIFIGSSMLKMSNSCIYVPEASSSTNLDVNLHVFHLLQVIVCCQATWQHFDVFPVKRMKGVHLASFPDACGHQSAIEVSNEV